MIDRISRLILPALALATAGFACPSFAGEQPAAWKKTLDAADQAIQSGHFKEGMALYDKALKDTTGGTTPNPRAPLILSRKGLALRKQGNFAASEITLRLALNIAKAVPRSEYLESDIAQRTHDLASACSILQKLREAESLYLQALAIDEKVGSKLDSTHMLWVNELSDLYTIEKRYKEAEDCLKKAVDTYAATAKGDRMLCITYCQALRRLSDLALQHKSLAAAVAYHDQAMKLLKGEPKASLGEHAAVAIAITDVQLADRDYQKAAQILSRMISRLEASEVPDKNIIQGLQNKLGACYMWSNDLPHAQSAYDKLLKLSAGNPLYLAQCYAHLGEVAYYRKQRDKGWRLLKKAADIAEDHKQTSLLVEVNYWLARMLNEQNKHAESAAYLGKSLSCLLSLPAHDANTLVTIYNDLGACYLSSGHYADAKAVLSKALEIETKSTKIQANLVEATQARLSAAESKLKTASPKRKQ